MGEEDGWEKGLLLLFFSTGEISLGGEKLGSLQEPQNFLRGGGEGLILLFIFVNAFF